MPSQAQDQPQILPKPVQRRSKRITEYEANQISQAIAELKMTESEACIDNGIKPQAWFSWKSRRKNVGRFDNMLARVRASTIRSCFENIKRGEAKDWRASLCRLQLLDRNRFSVQPQQESQVAVTIDLAPTLKALARVYGDQPKTIACGVSTPTSSGALNNSIHSIPQDTQAIDVQASVKQEQ